MATSDLLSEIPTGIMYVLKLSARKSAILQKMFFTEHGIDPDIKHLVTAN